MVYDSRACKDVFLIIVLPWENACCQGVMKREILLKAALTYSNTTKRFIGEIFIEPFDFKIFE